MATLRCNMCQEHYNYGPKKPIVMSCGHTYCFECVQKEFERYPEKESIYFGCCEDCPTTWPQSMERLVTNRDLLALIDDRSKLFLFLCIDYPFCIVNNNNRGIRVKINIRCSCLYRVI